MDLKSSGVEGKEDTDEQKILCHTRSDAWVAASQSSGPDGVSPPMLCFNDRVHNIIQSPGLDRREHSSSLWLVYSTKRAIIIVLWMIQQLKFDPCASAHASELVTGKGRKGLVTPLDDGRLFTYTDLLKCLSKFSFYCDNSFKYISKLNHCRFSINYYCGIKMWVNRRRTCQTRWGSYPLNSRMLFRTVPISGVVNCLFICHQDLYPVTFSGTVCIAMKRS